MDGKGFFLGLIAAVVLFMLWKRESTGMNFNFAGLVPGTSGDGSGASGGCSGCSESGTGCAGCGAAASAAVSPAMQARLADSGGFVTPGTPPLQTSIGSGSFYAASGPTSDSSFTNYPSKPVSTSVFRSGTPTVSGSATTPANKVPPRSVQQVPRYANQGFHQRFNVAGVPRNVLRKMGYIQ